MKHTSHIHDITDSQSEVIDNNYETHHIMNPHVSRDVINIVTGMMRRR